MEDTKETVLLQEVGPRDGLQNEPRVLQPEARAGLIDSLAEAGLPRIQIGSFVNPRKVPQMAGTDLVWRLIRKSGKTLYSVLVLNDKGLDMALDAGIPHAEIYVSASGTHSMKNSGASTEKALEGALGMIRRALTQGIGVTAGVMCAFGCFYEGPVPVEKVLGIVAEFEKLSPTDLALADTSGMADPEGIRRVVRPVASLANVDRLGLHLHDTRGRGKENLIEALQLGVRRFDTSVGGLGGCPFIPGAVGNISTEGTAKTLELLGYRTGIDIEKVIEASRSLERMLQEEDAAG
jgi:hydroxymethylglutaryl-CoA lyase